MPAVEDRSDNHYPVEKPGRPASTRWSYRDLVDRTPSGEVVARRKAAIAAIGPWRSILRFASPVTKQIDPQTIAQPAHHARER